MEPPTQLLVDVGYSAHATAMINMQVCWQSEFNKHKAVNCFFLFVFF